MESFYRQWNARLGLEMIKLRHALVNRPGDAEQKRRMKAEIEGYIAKAYADEEAAQLKDVYVTDRVPKHKKYATINKKDDEQFFRYQ